jgi:hypothetical protein
MADEPLAASLDRELTANIVAAYVRRNQIRSDQLATLISMCIGRSPSSGNRHQKSKSSGHLPSRYGDRLISISSFASNAAGAARCSDGISLPDMD